MSFVYDIRNLKDCQDFKNKREEFFRLLRLQAKLNRNYEQATIARQQMEQLGITPVMQARRSLEDEQKDLMLQQQLAMKNLRSIMTDDEVRRTIHILNENQIYYLNTEFGRIAPFLQGRTNITADFFKRVLERFWVYLQSTGMTGVPIPLRESTLQEMPGDLVDEWEQFAKGNIDPTTGEPMDVDELIERTAEVLKRPVEDIKEEVESEIKMDVEIKKPSTDFEPTPQPQARGTKRKPSISKQSMLVKRPRTMDERSMKRKIEEIITGVEAGLPAPTPRGQRGAEPPEMKRPKLQEDDVFTGMTPKPPARVPKRKAEATPTLPEKKARADSAAVRGVKRKNDAYVESVSQKMAATGPLTVDQARSLARAELEARQRAYVPPTRAKPTTKTGKKKKVAFLTPVADTQTEMEEMEYMPVVLAPLDRARQEARAAQQARADARAKQILEQGNGLFISPQRTTGEYGAPAVFSKHSHTGGALKHNGHILKKNGRILGKCGAGIQSNEEVGTYSRYRQIGRYVLHVPSLQKSLINIKYPSLMTIPNIPKKFVSQQFIDVLLNVMDNGQLDKGGFNRLSEEEQDYFKVLARKCQFDQAIGLGIGKSQSKEELDELERFEMLRGTVIAGNNSPEVLTELRRFILKFLNERRIPKQVGHDLLYEMACLG